VNLFNSIAVAVISVGLYLLLIPRYGIVGAAAAYSCGQLIINTMRVVEVRFLAGMSPLKGSFWKPLAAALAAFSAVDLLRRGGLVEGVTAGWVFEMALLWAVYGGATWALGIDEEDRTVLNAVKKKIRGKFRRG
jgi:O-antigen/teichoic acid export membrane protein